MNRLLFLASLLALSLTACIPVADQTPAAERYAASPETALTYLETALESLEANGYGPYRVSPETNGVLTASWTSGANVTYSIVASVRRVSEGVVEVAIMGSTTNPEQSAYTAVLYLYGELGERMTRLE